MIACLRTILAQRKLARMVAKRRASFEIRDFAKRRAAALKHSRRLAT